MVAASMTGCGAKTAETTAASETTTAAGTMAAETTTVAETAGKVSQTKPLVVYLNDSMILFRRCLKRRPDMTWKS